MVSPSANKENEGQEPQKREKHIRYLFKKPKTFSTTEQRHQQTHEHRHENWMELFIDLFYVAFFVKLGVIFHTCGTGTDIMVFVVTIFTGVYMCKFDFDQYMNKFTSEDLVHKIFFAIYSLGLAVMILDVNESSEAGNNDEYSESKHRFLRFLAGSTASDAPLYCPEVAAYIAGFTSGWIITRSSILLMYIVIAFYVRPQGRFLLESKAPILITSISIMIINYFIHVSEQYLHTYIIMSATLVEFFGWAGWEVLAYGSWLIRTKGPTALIPTNIHHYASRTGTFVMLVLGEAVLALLTPTLLSTVKVFTFTLLGVLLIFILALLYFDAQPQGHSAHALGISRFQGMIWISLHPILSFTLFGVGVTLKLMYEDIIEKSYHPHNKQALGVYLGLSLFTLALIRATHKVKFNRNQLFTLTLRCVIASLHILVPTLVDAWKYRHLEDSGDSSPLPVSRIPTAENRPLRSGSGGLSHLAYSPSIRNTPIRPRRSASTNDMYVPSANPAAIAVQNLKGDKPTAIIKQVRRSSLNYDDNGSTQLRPLRGNSSNNINPRGPDDPTTSRQRVTRRKSSSEIEMGKATLFPLHQPSLSPMRTDPKREFIRPALSILTDNSDCGEHHLVPVQVTEDEICDELSPNKGGFGDSFGETEEDKRDQKVELTRPQILSPQPSVRTRIFEYNERNELVEVDIDTLEEVNDEAYDEEYIELVYEDVDDGADDVEDEIHIYEAPIEVASHITWM